MFSLSVITLFSCSSEGQNVTLKEKLEQSLDFKNYLFASDELVNFITSGKFRDNKEVISALNLKHNTGSLKESCLNDYIGDPLAYQEYMTLKCEHLKAYTALKQSVPEFFESSNKIQTALRQEFKSKWNIEKSFNSALDRLSTIQH